MSTPTTPAANATDRGLGLPVVPSTATGIATFLGGYLLTWLLAGAEIRDQLAGAVPEWKAAGWYYFAAHFVDLVSTGSAGPFSSTGTLDLLAAGEGNAAVLYAVPPLVLFAGGVVLAAFLDLRDPRSAAGAGTLVATGYAAAAVVAAVLVRHSVSGDVFGVALSASVRPQFAGSVILAGVVYPVVFASLGAVVGAFLFGSS